LYIGAFACSMAMLLLVLLKEYARDVLGLHEREVLAGSLLDTSDEDDSERVINPSQVELQRGAQTASSAQPGQPERSGAGREIGSATQPGQRTLPVSAQDVGSSRENGQAPGPRRWTFLG
jgi:hypothetical protein